MAENLEMGSVNVYVLDTVWTNALKYVLIIIGMKV